MSDSRGLKGVWRKYFAYYSTRKGLQNTIEEREEEIDKAAVR